MTEPFYTDPLITLLHGDCIEVMAGLEADSVDAVVTDPPYGLEFMGKGWDAFRPATANRGGKAPGRSKQDPTKFAPVAYGIGGRRSTMVCDGCGKRDKFTNPHTCPPDTGWTRIHLDDDPRHAAYGQAFQAWCEQWGTRTHHRLVCALEDAGWIIRDELDWIYASGFPKGKANLKPAHEPIVLARKPGPLRPLGIDECRIGTDAITVNGYRNDLEGVLTDTGTGSMFEPGRQREPTQHEGRWPSNVLLSDPELFDQANPYVVGSGATSASRASDYDWGDSDNDNPTRIAHNIKSGVHFGDSGGYSRFFIIPKADRAERERGLAGTSLEIHLDGAFAVICAKCNRQKVNVPGAACKCEEPEWVRQSQKPRANVHPTVKPIDLMRHLVRLVTPVDGVVLDPFLGSGTTCLAASEEGFRSIGIEQSEEYLEIAKGRLMATPMGLGLDVPAPTTSRKVGRDKGGGTHCSFFPGKCEGHPGHGRYSPTIHANPNSEEPAA
jgi:hypothetical protein